MGNRSDKKNEFGIEWGYTAARSKYSKNYYYIIEIETDEYGTRSKTITKPLTRDELMRLSREIIETLNQG